ncbi:hypothetical protein [Burkholderia ubonensis]|uniref:hypothetical protein n=1 Tax=Burkholderia ubonensis TaxID=101571 RepID=UPI000753C27F|nr:hypothetical protein [Burkholderia ubonensis]KVN70823.1 hypothetical protein WJ67_25590 [Burkholderia ubonensis]KWD61624.1 hypothetical protein WL66_33475 [Burkholderia ubonensis]
MQTPWGRLEDLDLTDHDLAAEILGADKHQLIEGLVVECLFDQIVTKIPTDSEQRVLSVDVESVVVDTGREIERWVSLVWARSRGDGLGRYLRLLEKCFVPYLVDYQNGEFRAARVRNGAELDKTIPLLELMQELSRKRVTPFQVDELVKNQKRQRQAFWGFISEYYGSEVGTRVILPRILINCAIQPYFRSVWNLDRIFLVGDDIWLFEVKHKYPMGGRSLRFGINVGELGVLDRLAGAGIRCLHTILVKPYWSKDVGSMYLMNDLDMRARAALIATVLDKSRTKQIMRQQSAQSAAHTSITGTSTLSYKSIEASEFHELGQLSDGAERLASRMAAVMNGTIANPVRQEWLERLRFRDSERS